MQVEPRDPDARERADRSLLAPLLGLALVAGAGCKPPPFVVHVPFPEGFQSAVVAIEGDQIFDLYAIDAAARGDVPLVRQVGGFDGRVPVDVTVLYYPETLAQLFLTPGHLKLLSDPGTGRPVPQPAAVQHARVTTSGVGSFAPAAALDPAINAARIPSPCRSFSHAPTNPVRGTVIGSVPLSPSSALVVTATASTPSYFVVELSGPHEVSDPIPGFMPHRLVRARDGTLFLSGHDVSTSAQALWQGTLAAGFTRVLEPLGQGAPSCSGGSLGADGRCILALSASNSTAEPAGTLYAVDRADRVYRFSDGAWTVTGTLPAPGPPRDYEHSPTAYVEPRIAAGAPGELFVVQLRDLRAILPAIVSDTVLQGGSQLLRFSGGQVSVEREWLTYDIGHMPTPDSFTAIAVLPGVGVLAGTFLQALYQRDASTASWTELKPYQALLAGQIHSMVPYGGGLALVGDSGYLGQYYPNVGVCKPDQIPFRMVETVVALEGGLVLGGMTPLLGGIDYSWQIDVLTEQQ